jgi:ABC-type multidrug transport system fused ATPase/permease subunit
MPRIGYRLPNTIFRYVFAVSWRHQIALVALTVITFLLEVVPLEIQRRAVNDLVKERSFSLVVLLCAVYAGVVLVQGSTKLAVNVYRAWVAENAIRDLRRHVLAYLRIARAAAPGPEARGVGAAMIVGEVEPIGGFVGSSLSEPLLQAGIMLSVLAYIVHLDRWMAAAAFALFLPQLVFVPFMQGAINRRAGARVWVLRQLGVSTVDTRAPSIERDLSDGKRIDRVLQLNMGIYKFKFSMNFLMNLCSHLQVVGALLIGGWMVHTDQLEVGGIVAFISGVGRLNDPWGDLVNYFRDLSLNQVKYSLVAQRINQLSERWASIPIDQRTAFRVGA